MLRLFFIALFLSSNLAGCAQNTHTPDLTMMPPINPSDALLHKDVRAYLLQTKSPLNSQYQYARFDLNDDGLQEGIALITIPHHYWCESRGCTMLVFKAREGGFAAISAIRNIRPPVLISPILTKGWKDFVLNLSGQNDYDRTSVLMFDGTSYPSDAATAPSVPYPVSSIEGTRLFP